MKKTSRTLAVCLLAMTGLYATAEDTAYTARIDGAQPLFNGKDLSGWHGNPTVWSVEDGVIFGNTHGTPLKGNTFLILDSEDLEDFHLSYEARCEDNNSGVMYCSLVLDEENFVMKGYQCDLHPNPPYLAMLYGEKERGIIVTRGKTMTINEAGEKTTLSSEAPAAVDTAAWQTYEVICRGNSIVHKLNGQVAIDLTDNFSKRIPKGKIGLQLHAGPPMKVYFRNLQLKRLK